MQSQHTYIFIASSDLNYTAYSACRCRRGGGRKPQGFSQFPQHRERNTVTFYDVHTYQNILENKIFFKEDEISVHMMAKNEYGIL